MFKVTKDQIFNFNLEEKRTRFKSSRTLYWQLRPSRIRESCGKQGEHIERKHLSEKSRKGEQHTLERFKAKISKNFRYGEFRKT